MHKITDRYRIFFIYLALAIITRVAFWQVHGFEFVNYDDGDYVTANEHISTGLRWANIVWVFTQEHSGNWHPVTGLSHMLDCQLFGLKPGLHHLVNLLFHIANTLVLFTVLRRMTGAVWRSAFVAALFAIHPLHVESVAWVSERKDVLSTFFWFLTMAGYLRYTKAPKAGWYLLTLFLFAAGLMAKPMLVTLPFVFLLVDYWPLERLEFNNRRQIYRLVCEKIPFFILSGASSVVTFIFQKSGGALQEIQILPMSARVGNAVISYWQYIVKMIWPARLAVFYPHAGGNLPYQKVLVAAAMLMVITLFVIRFSRSRGYLFTGWFWYVGTLVPVIGLVQVGDQAMADRYSYVPLTGLFIIIVWGLWDLVKNYKHRRIALAVSSITVISVLSICTWVQSGNWRSSRSLFEHALNVTGENYAVCNGLGLALIEQGEFEQAVELLDDAVRLRGDYEEAYNNLCIAFGSLGRYDDAIAACNRAILINPDYAEAYYNLGIVFGNSGRYEESIEASKQALNIKPGYADAHYNLGVVYLLSAEKDSAMREYEILKNLDAEKAGILLKMINK